jgi:hypothetical protein
MAQTSLPNAILAGLSLLGDTKDNSLTDLLCFLLDPARAHDIVREQDGTAASLYFVITTKVALLETDLAWLVCLCNAKNSRRLLDQYLVDRQDALQIIGELNRTAAPLPLMKVTKVSLREAHLAGLLHLSDAKDSCSPASVVEDLGSIRGQRLSWYGMGALCFFVAPCTRSYILLWQNDTLRLVKVTKATLSNANLAGLSFLCNAKGGSRCCCCW